MTFDHGLDSLVKPARVTAVSYGDKVVPVTDSPPRQLRCAFYPPGAGTPVTSVWCEVSQADSVWAIVPLCDPEPEFAPGAGWRVVGRGLDVTVMQVEGRTLFAQ